MAALSQGGSHFQAMGKLQVCILPFFCLTGIQYFHRLLFHESITHCNTQREKLSNWFWWKSRRPRWQETSISVPWKMWWFNPSFLLCFSAWLGSRSHTVNWLCVNSDYLWQQSPAHPEGGILTTPVPLWAISCRQAGSPRIQRMFYKTIDGLSHRLPLGVRKGKPQKDNDLGFDLTHKGLAVG